MKHMKKWTAAILAVITVFTLSACGAKEEYGLTDGLSFENSPWNDSMKENFAGLDQQPQLGDPVSGRTNSGGQLQTSCYLVPLSAEKLTDIWKENDNNLSYEEFSEKEHASLK